MPVEQRQACSRVKASVVHAALQPKAAGAAAAGHWLERFKGDHFPWLLWGTAFLVLADMSVLKVADVAVQTSLSFQAGAAAASALSLAAGTSCLSCCSRHSAAESQQWRISPSVRFLFACNSVMQRVAPDSCLRSMLCFALLQVLRFPSRTRLISFYVRHQSARKL